MASKSRQPLAPRPQAATANLHAISTTTRKVSKRARSPDLVEHQPRSAHKRPRTVDISHAVDNQEHKRKSRQDKHEEMEDWKRKHRGAFPGYRIWIDPEIPAKVRGKLETRALRLNATLDDFFSKNVTHVITNKTTAMSAKGKENASGAVRQSNATLIPISGNDPVSIAQSMGKKIWNANKFDDIMSRCLELEPMKARSRLPDHPDLDQLLHDEKVYGTGERNRTEKQFNCTYFSKKHHFLLLEDATKRYATLMAKEMPYPTGSKLVIRDTLWPVLFCSPEAKSPFIPCTKKKKQLLETPKAGEDFTSARQPALCSRKPLGDLRRAASMTNIRAQGDLNAVDTRLPPPGNFVKHAIANPSGYLPSVNGSGYVAASGNSISIMSTTTGTTSTNNGARPTALPSHLRLAQQREVTTSRRVSAPSARLTRQEEALALNRPYLLRKSRSTNTLRPPRREETAKPGHCENCRMRFDDFKLHVKSRRHRQFAMNDANFLDLDMMLARVERRTFADARREAVVDSDDDPYFWIL